MAATVWCDAVRRCRDLSARKMIDFLHRDLMEWTGSRGRRDDVTFFVIKAL
jgi:hypothetical protein